MSLTTNAAVSVWCQSLISGPRLMKCSLEFPYTCLLKLKERAAMLACICMHKVLIAINYLHTATPPPPRTLTSRPSLLKDRHHRADAGFTALHRSDVLIMHTCKPPNRDQDRGFSVIDGGGGALAAARSQPAQLRDSAQRPSSQLAPNAPGKLQAASDSPPPALPYNTAILQP